MSSKRGSRPSRHGVRARGLGVAAAVALALAAVLLPGPSAAAPTCSAERGQALIEAGRYQPAIPEFTCLVDAAPTEVEGYRGRMEAKVLLGRYADAFADYALVTAFVLPVHPDAQTTVLAGYDARLAADRTSRTALTGAAFARWCFFSYPQAIQLTSRLLELDPDDVFASLFRGSSRLLKGVTTDRGIADLDRALALAPKSPDVRFIVADAYTYGLADYERALAEASLALQWGLDTPRVHAILGAAYNAFGEEALAAAHIATHIEQVTTELVPAGPLAPGGKLALALVPGRTYELAVPVVAGERIAVKTRSNEFWDSIAVLISPGGNLVAGSDDDNAYFAAFDRVAEETGVYRIRVTSFEGVSTGVLDVRRR